MQASKLALWDSVQYFQAFDVILLSETRAVHFPAYLLPDYSIAYCPASQEGRGGEGLLVAVKQHLAYHVLDYGSDDSSLWVRLCFTSGRRPIIFGVVYVPPAGSTSLQAVDLEDRFTKLSARLAAAQLEGDVFLAGDFNARVGRLEESAYARQRGCTDLVVNSHGRRLLRLCSETGSLLCTGRLPGDEQAPFSFKAGARQSRVDHIVVSHGFVSQVHGCTVNTARQESDHAPLEADLCVPVPQTIHHPVCVGMSIRRRHWCSERQGTYCQALQSPACVELLRNAEQAATENNVDAAVQAFSEAVQMAADVGGMVAKQCSRKADSAQAHQPFFDAECLALKRQVRRLGSTGDPLARKALERRYHSLVRQRKRAYHFKRLQQLLVDERKRPRQFWKVLRAKHSDLPIGLQRVQAWESYIANLSHCGSAEGCSLPGAAYPQQLQADALNVPISLQEVLVGLQKLHNGRSSGSLGIPAELYRYAHAPTSPGEAPSEHLLAPVLTKVLNSLFQAGTVPACVNEGLVTPVFKKGDPFHTANYRPIAVTEPLMRLYAAILNVRLQSFTEQHHLRAATQTGFRPHLSTEHQLFALQSFIDNSHASSKPLYCCFLDLKGAYDKVQRPLLWQVLARLGVHGRMLGALQSMYETANIRVNIQGRAGERVPSHTGLRQGCPLSPTLFGLFADGLHRFLLAECPDQGPVLSDGRHVPDLGYADDFVLLADTPEGLQRLIDATIAFCVATGMQICIQKTKVLVFAKRWPGPYQWLCNHQPLEWVDKIRYLGLQFDSHVGLHATYSSLHSKMWAAWALLQKQFRQLQCATSVGLLFRLYKTCIPPTALYGAGVWGPYRLPPPISQCRAALLRSHLQMLKQIAGVRSTVPTAILLRELDCKSLDYEWWLCAVRFWNGLVALPPQHLYKRIALDACRAAITSNIKNWAWAMFKGIREMGYDMVISATDMVHLDVQRICQLLDGKMDAVWQDLDYCPRTCPSSKARLCTYRAWCARPDSCRRKSYINLPLSASRLRQVLKFRMGCHGLPRDSGSWTGVPRVDRVCRFCGTGSMGDERHVVFECPHLQSIRDKYAGLVSVSTMVQFFWQDDLVSVSKFLCECMDVMLGADSDDQSQTSDQP